MQSKDTSNGPSEFDSWDASTREQFLKRSAAGGLALGASGLLAACGGSSSKSSTGATGPSGSPAAGGKQTLKQGGNMRIGLEQGGTSDSVDPHTSIGSGDGARQFSLYNQLTQTRASVGESKVSYDLAEEITSNKDATEWTIRLRDGVEFHNGKTLDVDDLIYTHKRITDPKTASVSFARWILMDMKAAKKLDKRTLRVPLVGPNAILPALVGQTTSAGIIPVGFDVKHPIGTGPFKFKSFTPGRQAVFERFENYYGEKAKVDTLTLVALPDETARYNALLSGQIDILDGVPLAQIDALKANSRFVVSSLPSAKWFPIYMRVDRPPFNDVRVRQALRLAVNRQQVVQTAFHGNAAVGNDVFGRFDPLRDQSLKREQDLEQAKSLLKQAGREGFRSELVVGPVGAGAVEMCQVFAENVKGAGANISLRQVDLGTMYGPNYGKWPFGVDSWPGFVYLVQTASWSGAKSPVNLSHQNNPRYASLYSQALAELDEEKRAELIHELEKIDFNTGGAVIAAYPNYIAAYTKQVGGFYPANLDGGAVDAGQYNQLGFVA